MTIRLKLLCLSFQCVSTNRIRIYTEGQLGGATCLIQMLQFTGQKAEQSAQLPWGVFIGQNCQFTGQKAKQPVA